MDELDNGTSPLEPEDDGRPGPARRFHRPRRPVSRRRPRSPSARGSGSASAPPSSSSRRCSTHRRAAAAVSPCCCAGGKVAVPLVVGQPQAQAESLITSAGLRVGQVSQVDTLAVPPGTVVQQTPAPDTKVKADSAVDIAVSAVPQVQVPDVTGKTESAASETLAEQGLRIGTVSYVNDPDVDAGDITAQDPSAGTDGRGRARLSTSRSRRARSRAWSPTWSASRRATPSPPSRAPASSRRARRRRAPASPPATSSASPRRPAWSRRPAAP